MKKLMFLTILASLIQLNCFAGESAAVRVSVIIPELPKTVANKDKTAVAVQNNEQVSSNITVTNTENRGGEQVVVQTNVAR